MRAIGFRRGLVAGLLGALMALVASPGAMADEPGEVRTVVDGGGQRQWVHCAGTGGPTVVLVSGLAADHTMWSRVFDRLAGVRRTCIVDRPGLGASPARVGSRTVDAGDQARELRAALQAAGETGPFVLVAHSYGGLIGRAFRQQQPASVAGLLLLEAVWPGIDRDFLPSYASPWHEAGTALDITAGSRAARGPLAPTPVLVIAAGKPGNGSAQADDAWTKRQRQIARTAHAPLWIARGSGHVVQRDEPGIVVRGVQYLLEKTTRTS